MPAHRPEPGHDFQPEHLRCALMALQDLLVDARARAFFAVAQQPACSLDGGDALLRADTDAEQRLAVVRRAISLLDQRAHDEIDGVRDLLRSISHGGVLPLSMHAPATHH